MLTKLGVALLLLGAPLFAQASIEEGITQDFRRNARVLPQALRSLSYRSLGALNPSALLDEIDRIDISVVAAVDHLEQAGQLKWDRQSAEWTREGNGTIHVSGPFWQKTPSLDKPVLALHETLGARGFSDDGFDCSTSIWTLTNAEARANLRPEELAAVEATARGACQLAGGGSTGIGGGGDDFAVRAKLNAIQRNLRTLRGIDDSATRKAIVGDMQVVFAVTLETNRREKDTAKKYMEQMQHYCFNYRPVLSTIKVSINEAEVLPVAQDPKDGWSFDAANPRCLIFHGKSAAAAAHPRSMEVMARKAE